jgi:hypothetical protein
VEAQAMTRFLLPPMNLEIKNEDGTPADVEGKNIEFLGPEIVDASQGLIRFQVSVTDVGADQILREVCDLGRTS